MLIYYGLEDSNPSLTVLITSSFIVIFVPGSLLQVPLHSKDHRQGES